MDLRFVAAIVAVFASCAGYYLSLQTLVTISAAALLVAIFFVWNVSRKTPSGTSAGLGALIIAVGGLVSIFVPMWLTFLIKNMAF